MGQEPAKFPVSSSILSIDSLERIAIMDMMLIQITPRYDGYDCGDCGCGTFSGFNHEETSVESLLNKMDEWQLKNLGLVRVSPDANKKMSATAIMTLKNHGWVHAASAESRAKKKELEQKFHLFVKQGSSYLSYYTQFSELDLDNVTDEQLKQLAGNAEIVQKVTAKSVLSEKDYKRLKAIEKAKAEAAEKKAKTEKTKAAKKKAKEIEAAKKLLEEAGELSQKIEDKYPNVDLGENG